MHICPQEIAGFFAAVTAARFGVPFVWYKVCAFCRRVAGIDN